MQIYLFFLLSTWTSLLLAQSENPLQPRLSEIFDRERCGCNINLERIESEDYEREILRNFSLKALEQSFEVKGHRNSIAQGLIQALVNVRDEKMLEKTLTEVQIKLDKQPKKNRFVENLMVELRNNLNRSGSIRVKARWAACLFTERLHEYYLRYPEDCSNNSPYCLRYSGAGRSDLPPLEEPMILGDDSTKLAPAQGEAEGGIEVLEEKTQDTKVYLLLFLVGLGIFAVWKWGEKLKVLALKQWATWQKRKTSPKQEAPPLETQIAQETAETELPPLNSQENNKNKNAGLGLEIKNPSPSHSSEAIIPLPSPSKVHSSREQALIDLIEGYRRLSDKQESELAQLRRELSQAKKMLADAQKQNPAPAQPPQTPQGELALPPPPSSKMVLPKPTAERNPML